MGSILLVSFREPDTTGPAHLPWPARHPNRAGRPGGPPPRRDVLTARASWRRLSGICALLLILLGAAVSPARAADPIQDAITRALGWLHTQQRADGSFGGASVTADAVYTLALLGEDPDGPAWTVNGNSALDGLATKSAEGSVPYPTRGAGEAGKVLRAVALAGGNPRSFAGLDLIALVEAAYDPATGRYDADYLFRHTLAVEGLLRAGRPVPAGAYQTLLAAQLADGGWAWSFTSARGDVDTTGRVLWLLAGIAGVSSPADYSQAADYLEAAQLDSGGWSDVFPPLDPADPATANANSTALAVAGLKAAGFDPSAPRFQPVCRAGVQALLDFQEAGGAFRFMLPPDPAEVRLIATLEALAALSRPLVVSSTCLPFYMPLVLHSG